MTPAARRQYEALPNPLQRRIRAELLRLASAHGSGSRLGKAVKTLGGTEGVFHRLRVGDIWVMYDVIPEDRVLLVLGVVDRKDLDRWLRGR